MKPQNKANLASFYTKYLAEKAPSLLNQRNLFISGGNDNKTAKVTSNSRHDVQALCSNQEEADTRLILHAKYAADRGAETIIVVSPDTDVFVLLIYTIDRIFQQNIFIS